MVTVNQAYVLVVNFWIKVVIMAKSHLHSFFYKNVVFPAQAEYSYFSADFRLKIFLYYS